MNTHLLLLPLAAVLLLALPGALADEGPGPQVGLAGNYDTSGYAQSVAVSGGYAYVADDSGGLVVVDVSDPANPTWVGSYDPTNHAYDVAVSGNYAYIADRKEGLVVVDVSNPTNPTYAGNYNTSGNARGVAVSGDYAYIADGDYGVVVVDVSNPTNPTYAGSYNTSGYAHGVVVTGDYAYGLLLAEAGVHRLVRISPYDQAARRHTSFASVFVWPELPDDVAVEIEDKDLRIDTYRSSGAGGQHVNVTDSAVRITHLPTNIVVSCQNERSQHRNRDAAMKVLRARLYDLKLKQQQAKLEQIGGEKKEIAFGSQIRSYVLHPYRMVKDHRTKVDVGDVDRVLDGDLDGFIKAYLMQKAAGSTT